MQAAQKRQSRQRFGRSRLAGHAQYAPDTNQAVTHSFADNLIFIMAMDGATPGQEAAADEAQVTLQFITKLPAEFRVPETPVVRPGS